MAKLNEAMLQSLQRKDVADRLAAQGGIVPAPMTTAQVAGFVRSDVAMWRSLVAEEHIQAD